MGYETYITTATSQFKKEGFIRYVRVRLANALKVVTIFISNMNTRCSRCVSVLLT